jgi:hypothetical protein
VKLGRNDPCFSSSGLKYKRCHLNREKESPLPFAAIQDKVRRASKHSTCLHPSASHQLCGKVISAHTLQRARVLKAIADQNNKVLSFYPAIIGDDGRFQLHEKGWHQASTFEAFCDKHDSLTFAPLENNPFSGTKLQIFLIAYRAMCWELYQKTRATKAESTIRQLIDRGASPSAQLFAQERIGMEQAGFTHGLKSLVERKKNMDTAFIAKDYSSFETFEVVLDGPLTIAATGAVTPNRTISRAPLQVLHDPGGRLEWLAFGTDVGARGVSVVFCWSTADPAPRRYVQELKALSDADLAEFLVQFFFAHCENTYFAKSWFGGLDAGDQEFVRRHAENWNPYYFFPKFELNRHITPWRVIARN